MDYRRLFETLSRWPRKRPSKMSFVFTRNKRLCREILIDSFISVSAHKGKISG